MLPCFSSLLQQLDAQSLFFIIIFLFCFRACFQIAQGSESALASVQQFLHDFLNGWSLEHSQYSSVITEAASRDQSRRFILLPIVEYLQVVELYAVTLLATLQKNVDLAISWVENASLPEENRQVRMFLSADQLCM